MSLRVVITWKYSNITYNLKARSGNNLILDFIKANMNGKNPRVIMRRIQRVCINPPERKITYRIRDKIIN